MRDGLQTPAKRRGSIDEDPYGLSIHFYIMAQKELGAAKTSAYYSIAPFSGVAFSMLILGERPEWAFYGALLIMMVSTYLMVKDTLMLQHIIDRVTEMEACFDNIQAAVAKDPDIVAKDAAVKEMFEALLQYYEGGQWRMDYEYDEKGMLPADLKRGVLSEDGVYNLISDIEQQ